MQHGPGRCRTTPHGGHASELHVCCRIQSTFCEQQAWDQLVLQTDAGAGSAAAQVNYQLSLMISYGRHLMLTP